MIRVFRAPVVVVWLLVLSHFYLAGPSQAALIASENFNSYTAGAAVNGLNGGTGWTTAWSAIGAATLGDHATLDPVNPRAARVIAASSDTAMNRQFASQTGTIYLAFSIRGGNMTGGDDFLQFQLGSGTMGNTTSTASIIRSATGELIARTGNSTAGNSSTGGPIFALNGVNNTIVAKFSKTSGSTNYNTVDVYLNPSLLSEPVSPSVTHTSTGITVSSFNTFNVRTVSFADTGEILVIDNLRIGTDYASVVPEPSAAILALLGISGLAFVRPRSRRS